MAPHSSYKKHVKFARSRSPIPRKKVQASADSYANIVLHYLSKLKGLFQSPRRYAYFNESHDISKPILKKEPHSSSESDLESKQKAFEIVRAALQYGCANNVIEKVGNYFLVKNSERKVATRRPTPGPDYIRCAGCKNLAKLSESKSLTKVNKRGSNKHGRRNRYDEYSRGKRERSGSNTSLLSYCPKCYVRMKSKRR